MKNTIIFITTLCLGLLACKPAKATNDCKGKANPDCVCTEQYQPVCGCDNKTYGNACVAECAGVKKYTKGKCPGTSGN
jgi:Kazal-type serine protease inhibitor domain